MGFNLEGHDEWIEKYKKVWNAVKTQLLQCLTTLVVNNGKYMNPKLKMYSDKYLYNMMVRSRMVDFSIDFSYRHKT